MLYIVLMKKLLLIILLFACLPSFGQYKKLIDENKMWVVNYYSWSSYCPSISTLEEYYYEYFKGDTIHQGKNYKKLYHQTFYSDYFPCSPPNIIDSSLQQPELVGFAREDTVLQQIFFVDPFLGGPNEFLLFDFSLSVGDTISTLFYSPHSGVFSNPIDSISEYILPNNDTSKVLYFDFEYIMVGNLQGNFMIEGVGGPGGIYYPYDWTPSGNGDETRTLICYQENSINLLGDCTFPSSIVKNTNKVNFDIFPNPTSGNFTIKLEKQDKANITIYNIAGKTIFNKQYAPNDLIDINIDAPSGLYFVKVETDKGVFTEKIIKQ